MSSISGEINIQNPELGCLITTNIVNLTAIQSSVDSGTTYLAYTLGNNVTNIAGSQTTRFRGNVLIGAALFASNPTYVLRMVGDLHDAPANDLGYVYVDGVLIGRYTPALTGATFQLPALSTGNHTIEWRHGTSSAGGLSAVSTLQIEYVTTKSIEIIKTLAPDGTWLSNTLREADGTVIAQPLPTNQSYTVGECPIINKGYVSIIPSCAEVGSSLITYGENLLANGDFLVSTGTGATSNPGSGWTTNYTPAANIFAAGANTYAFFTTNAGAVTGGNAIANGIPALTGRSMAVNVSGTLTNSILQWTNVYLVNGLGYNFQADAAIINAPYGVAIYIDGVLFTPLTTPAVNGAWEKTNTPFTWTGATGYHTVAVRSNNGAAAGNDHCFDNFEMRLASLAVTEVTRPVAYENTVRALVAHVVKVTNCKDDRRDTELAQIARNTAKSTNPQIRSTYQRLTAAGNITIPAGARSISVAVNTGSPTLTIGANPAVALFAGLAQSWQVDQGGLAGENLADQFVFTWVAGADFTVSTTREI